LTKNLTVKDGWHAPFCAIHLLPKRLLPLAPQLQRLGQLKPFADMKRKLPKPIGPRGVKYP
jgi:hypothetical protein